MSNFFVFFEINKVKRFSIVPEPFSLVDYRYLLSVYYESGTRDAAVNNTNVW